MTSNLKELIENQTQAAALLIDRAILRLPEGVSSEASRQLVDLIVGAAMLEVIQIGIIDKEQS